WERPEIFHWLQNTGNIEESEMLKTFNCGIGMILVVNPKETNNLLNKLKELGEEPSLIGKIIHNENPETLVVYK
ncbi:MAG: phosphoribosylformylglycinamidine cyclo-ligase, partial [SAR202 cluster bacterium]